jgi:hypothetical protein
LPQPTDPGYSAAMKRAFWFYAFYFFGFPAFGGMSRERVQP